MLKIYPVALELIRQMSPGLKRVRARSSALGDQFERALTSVVLNTADRLAHRLVPALQALLPPEQLVVCLGEI